MSTGTNMSAQVVFIDIATFSELEGFLYGGPNSITWFVASVQKSNWFSFIPISLRLCGSQAQFGASKVSYNLSRQGDYVLSVYLRAIFPAIGFLSTITAGNCTVRWCDWLMHNLIRHCEIEFNDLTVQEMDSTWLDDNFQLRAPGEKRIGYRNMVGMTSFWTLPVGIGASVGGGPLSVPLPFFFGEDSGVALPVAALPFNEVRITFDFRDWKELVIINPGTTAVNINSIVPYINGVAQNSAVPALSHVECFAHYALVHNDERVKMGDAPRDILMHQIQQIQIAPFKDMTTRNSFDIRMSHALVCFTFHARNNSLQKFFNGIYGHDQSNYTTLSSVLITSTVTGVDPIDFSTLFYENNVRLALASDYYALIHPWYFSDAIPEITGYHFYSYALKPWDPTRPSGSTNYSKLANVSIAHDPSGAAQLASTGHYADGTNIVFPTGAQALFVQSWEHIFNAKNLNIIRVANGSLGFPTL